METETTEKDFLSDFKPFGNGEMTMKRVDEFLEKSEGDE